MFVAAVLVMLIILLILLKHKVSLAKHFDGLDLYFNLTCTDFATFNKIGHIPMHFHRFLIYKSVFVNDPQLITKVLNCDSCIDKPALFYNLLGFNKGMISAKSKHFHVNTVKNEKVK